MCEFCKEGKDLLIGEIDKFNDIVLFGMKDSDTATFGELRKYFETDTVRVFIDRGHLRVTIGEDIGCLDHSIDTRKISYCPDCGEKIN